MCCGVFSPPGETWNHILQTDLSHFHRYQNGVKSVKEVFMVQSSLRQWPPSTQQPEIPLIKEVQGSLIATSVPRCESSWFLKIKLKGKWHQNRQELQIAAWQNVTGDRTQWWCANTEEMQRSNVTLSNCPITFGPFEKRPQTQCAAFQYPPYLDINNLKFKTSKIDILLSIAEMLENVQIFMEMYVQW